MAEKLSELFNELSATAEEDEALAVEEQATINDMKNASIDEWFILNLFQVTSI